MNIVYKYYVFFIQIFSIFASIPFIEKGRRSKIFELTDKEIAVFKINLPENEFQKIKYNAIHHEESFKYYINKKYTKKLKAFIEILKDINFKEVYPEYNYIKLLPQLKINEKGYAIINDNEILESLKSMKNNFKEFNFSNDIILNKQLLEYNPSINITHIIDVFQNKFQHTTDKQVKIYNKISNVFSPIEKYDILYSKKYKTKNSSMVVELNGTYNNSKIEKFKEMTVKVGGRSSNEYGKPCINIKIRGKKNLYGRKQFKLRPGARDATYLRSKLACDIHNRLGLPSISANYITLYINDEYIGLYILMDSIKPSWIEYVFGEKNTSTLYKCENLPYGLNEQSYKGCPNENENVTNHSEWKNFLSTIEQAKKADDVENILDIDLFLKEIALEYLFGSWDHYPTSDHNFYFYKANDNKWKYLIYDFDAEFGQDLNKITNMSIQEDENRQINYDLFQYSKDENKDYTKQSFVDWIGSSKSNLINILIINNPERFVSILKEIVSKSFNPAILFPHIDELKKIIKPYVQKDKEPDINGKYPGQFNASVKIYSVAQWDANSEYTTIYNFLFDTEAYGLKYWILSKYRYICQALGMNCDSNYINDFKYSIKTDVRNKYINPFNDNNLKHWNDDL